MIYNNLLNLVFDDVFLSLDDVVHERTINLKMEGFSIGGSIKIKPAIKSISRMELEGTLTHGKTVIESSSGNFGIALSIVCASKGYQFICVTDPNILPSSERLIRAYGGEIIKVTKKDSNGGYLQERIDTIRTMTAADSNLIWVNQYCNIDNLDAHYLNTGPNILKQFPHLDYLFVGAGTTGTLGGVSRYFHEYSPHTKIIAVDSKGSVTFGGKSGKRLIPGLGTSSPPAIRTRAIYDDLVMVGEDDTIKMCQKLARKGLLVGGSTGTVIQGILQYSGNIPKESSIVAISPDFGEKYTNTIFNSIWVKENFPDMDYQERLEEVI
ncbi:2,3-diaminopropionate biosynthesis protein SbnA [Brenneria goodwinii]|uniref:2,3-diaminopropionate biosynthesis protein SbnA n=1 Tax=Brenneria goodwinii TaxID=1109412 RepID=UPI0036E2BB2B